MKRDEIKNFREPTDLEWEFIYKTLYKKYDINIKVGKLGGYIFVIIGVILSYLFIANFIESSVSIIGFIISLLMPLIFLIAGILLIHFMYFESIAANKIYTGNFVVKDAKIENIDDTVTDTVDDIIYVRTEDGVISESFIMQSGPNYKPEMPGLIVKIELEKYYKYDFVVTDTYIKREFINE